jgi:hypothetical protein
VRAWALAALIACGQAVAQIPALIDVHAHLVGRGGNVEDYPGAVRAAVSAMNDSGIRVAVIMPPPQTPDIRQQYDFAQFLPALREHPGRFAFLGGGGSLNVILARTGDAAPSAAMLADFERRAEAIIAAGAAGFGEIAAHHLSLTTGHPYQWTSPDHLLFLKLAEVAGRHEAVIELHLDLVPADMETPHLRSGANPQRLRANLAAFERLLAHDRRARIVWAHAGSDPLGFRTPQLSRELMARHANLYMSLRFPARMPRGAPGEPQHAIDGDLRASSAWVALVSEFPDRFMLGGDQFFPSPALRGSGPGMEFAQLAPRQREMTRAFLAALPPGVARRVAVENARRLYRLP